MIAAPYPYSTQQSIVVLKKTLALPYNSLAHLADTDDDKLSPDGYREFRYSF